MTRHSDIEVRKREDTFSRTIKTKIWDEDPCENNPYVAKQCRIHGYELAELSKSISFTDAIYLNLKGELPSTAQKQLLDAIFVALSNLGPRHPATRAVMNAAVSKTTPGHLLPIGLSMLSGQCAGFIEVENAIRFISKHINKPAASVAADLLPQLEADTSCYMLTPGFGQHNGSIDIVAQSLASVLNDKKAASRALAWGMAFSSALNHHNCGWLLTGIAAACFFDLGFTPKAGAGLFQIAATPGLLAHGLEMSTKPLTAMPFVDDANYHYE